METILRTDGSVWFVISKRRTEPSWTGEYLLVIAPHGNGSSPEERQITIGIQIESGWKEI